MFKTITQAALLGAALLAAPSFAQTSQLDASATSLSLQEETPKKKEEKAKDKIQKTDRKALKHYDLGKKGLALGGFDPVAYFPEYGGKATKGSKKITVTHGGVMYRFSSEKNKKAFIADPDRFEPAYGGWCAWAMSDGKGSKTEADPESFTVENGRLFVFYDGFWGDTRKSWKKNGSAPKLASKSDKNWKRIAGESARGVKTPAKGKGGDAGKGNGKG